MSFNNYIGSDFYHTKHRIWKCWDTCPYSGRHKLCRCSSDTWNCEHWSNSIILYILFSSLNSRITLRWPLMLVTSLPTLSSNHMLTIYIYIFIYLFTFSLYLFKLYFFICYSQKQSSFFSNSNCL